MPVLLAFNNETPEYPAESDVEEGVIFGNLDQFTGSFAVPNEDLVFAGTAYGFSAEFIGQLDDPPNVTGAISVQPASVTL